MNIYQEFKPTYLYIKQHTITGKLYFGKTINNPEKYNGSGHYWKRHIKLHGIKHITNLWYCLFYDQEELTKFAVMCSNQWSIVESNAWLNLKEENGIDGQLPGHLITPRISLDAFLTRSIKIHGHRYDYSNVKLIDSTTPVTIICSVHGNFNQKPEYHYNGSGCPKCSVENRKITPFNDFILMANAKHNNKFTYIESTYIGMEKQMSIICPIHGNFSSTPNSHLKYDCKHCSYNNKKKTILTAEFINKGNTKFNYKFEYSSIKNEILFAKEIINIKCPIHGQFKQTPNQHLASKYGCQSCANYATAINKRLSKRKT